MNKWLNLTIDTVSEILVIAVIYLNIKFGVGSGAALIGDSVVVFILISFFSSRIHFHRPTHHFDHE